MSTEGMAAIAASASFNSAMPLQNAAAMTANADSTGSAGFANMVTRGLGEINQQMIASQIDLQQLAVGNIENLHQIMMRLEETRVSFQMVMQVRNRLLEAYQDIMKMPI